MHCWQNLPYSCVAMSQLVAGWERGGDSRVSTLQSTSVYYMGRWIRDYTTVMDKDKQGSALKKILTGLDSNRRNIEANTDVTANIVQARESFAELEGAIKGQTGVISSLKTFEKSMVSQNSKTLEVKKFFTAFGEKMKFQINKLVKLGQDVFVLKGQKSNKEQDYEKSVDELNKIVNGIREQSDTMDKMFSGITRLLAIRDNIVCQLMRVMLYKKNVLWRDLNIKFDDFIHAQVKAMLNKIKENEEKYGYVPSSLPFRVPKAELEGESVLPDLLNIIMQDQNQLLDSMKNFSKLSEQPQLIEDISKNQHIVKGLREKIQVLSKNYATLMQKYRALQISKGKHQLNASEEKSLNDRIEDLESVVMKKDQDISELKIASNKFESTIQSLKDRNKELEDEISKWQNFQLPKIKQLESMQKSLLDEFVKTKKDFQTYTNLYQVEREDKIKAYSDLKDEKSRLNEMANILGRERRKIKQLKQQLLRKDQIIFELVEKAPEP